MTRPKGRRRAAGARGGGAQAGTSSHAAATAPALAIATPPAAGPPRSAHSSRAEPASTSTTTSWLLDVMPPELVPLVMRGLQGPELLALFRTCHTTREWVLENAPTVYLDIKAPGRSRIRAMQLLRLPAADPCAYLQHLSLGLGRGLTVSNTLPYITALTEGRLASLHLLDAGIKTPRDVDATVAACEHLSSLMLAFADVSQPTFFPKLAPACTSLRYLRLDSLITGNAATEASLAALAEGLPELEELEVSGPICMQSALLQQPQQPQQPQNQATGASSPPGQALMSRVTSLDAWFDPFLEYIEEDLEEDAWDFSEQLVKAMETSPHLFSRLRSLRLGRCYEVPRTQALAALTALESLSIYALDFESFDGDEGGGQMAGPGPAPLAAAGAAVAAAGAGAGGAGGGATGAAVTASAAAGGAGGAGAGASVPWLPPSLKQLKLTDSEVWFHLQDSPYREALAQVQELTLPRPSYYFQVDTALASILGRIPTVRMSKSEPTSTRAGEPPGAFVLTYRDSPPSQADVEALAPMARHLGCVMLEWYNHNNGHELLERPLVSALGSVLGPHTHTLGLGQLSGFAPGVHWGTVLAALPLLRSLWLRVQVSDLRWIARLASEVVSGLGALLGQHTHTFGLQHVVGLQQGLSWGDVLAALPMLRSLWLQAEVTDLGWITRLAAACVKAGRSMELLLAPVDKPVPTRTAMRQWAEKCRAAGEKMREQSQGAVRVVVESPCSGLLRQ